MPFSIKHAYDVHHLILAHSNFDLIEMLDKIRIIIIRGSPKSVDFSGTAHNFMAILLTVYFSIVVD